jgi:hypothetical protein
MRLPLGPNTINQGARENVSGNGDGKINNWVLQFFGATILMGLIALVVIPVLLLLKNSVPRCECVLAQVSKVRWDIVFRKDNLGLLPRDGFSQGRD